ncbi:MAG: Acetyl-coenzyme carboxyl transferase beta chain [Myxococcaceae bacterium]|nr:Acetyl-coenzyme carboxyl transferase beta chain [Myxococcaceae bacterium]
MGWFNKTRPEQDASEKRTLGAGVFRRCKHCGVQAVAEEFTSNLEVCPSCHFHYPLSGEAWMELLCDPGSFEELDIGLNPKDFLGFTDAKKYADRIKGAQKQSGLKDAFLSGNGQIAARNVQLGTFMFRYMGGSMGSVVGEKITRMFERGVARKQPVILMSASGGARMQEGVLSLMQMGKTVAALGKLREARLPFISICLNPTTGGVAASFALLGDVNIAEPRALIGFAGPRVIENTIRQKLPAGFQTSEYLLEHGMIDLISQRKEMRANVARILSHLLD